MGIVVHVGYANYNLVVCGMSDLHSIFSTLIKPASLTNYTERKYSIENK